MGLLQQQESKKMAKNYFDVAADFVPHSEQTQWQRLQELINAEEPSKDGSTRRHGAKKRARILEADALERVLAYIDRTSRTPEIHRLKVLLSFKAGLRACEINGLKVADVTDAEGRVARFISVPDGISKNGKSRTIPMHPEIAKAIRAFRNRYPGIDRFGITQVNTRIRAQSVNALTVWFSRLYQLVGLQGCTSHSGRRTFITSLARRANEFHNSLRDVQVLAGHARLDTTETYIEPSENMHELVNSLGSETSSRTPRKRRLTQLGGEGQ
jgi:integrase